MNKYTVAPIYVPAWIKKAVEELRPRPRLPVSQWAEENRVLPTGSPILGLWQNSVTPYLTEIMDAFSDGDAEKIIFVKPTQVGGTSALENVLGSLICQDPAPAIQYLGRFYERGAALPANDPLMTAAWLKADSAAWVSPPAEEAPAGPAPTPDETRRREAERQAAEVLAAYGVAIADGAGNFIGREELVKQLISVPTAETLTASTLRTLGIEFMDEEGRFVGEERMKEQLCALAQTLLPDYEDVIPPAGTLRSGALPEEEDKILDVGLDGHFSRTSLARLTKAELLDLAKDLGVNLSGCRTNAERVEALAAVDAAAVLEKGTPDAPPESPPEEGAT